MNAALVLAASYLLGSIPFSYLIARQRGVDVRKVGSGNVGATNVMRNVGKGAGLVAFLLDAAKGAAAAEVALRAGLGVTLAALAAVAAIIGHMYPVWLRFRGGKGVATGAGAFFPLAPLATVCALGVFALTLAITRYASVASMAGAVSLSVLAALMGAPPPVWIASGLMAALIVWKHRANIARLAAGTESRLGRPADTEERG